MKAVVVGYGSIGARHARILDELGCQVALVSARTTSFNPLFSCLSAAVSEFAPDYIVIATETARHAEGMKTLAEVGFKGTLLIEKPALDKLEEDCPVSAGAVFVAYNLRFHPMLKRLRSLLEGEKVISVQAYVGQYLPLWRPERDYRKIYSASNKAGGGVLRDLSHELDLLNWLLDGWQKLTAIGGHFSSLEIDSEDVFSIQMTTIRCPVVTVQMNYLDRVGRRQLIVNTEKNTIFVDVVNGCLTVDGSREDYAVDRDHSYREMHHALLDGQSEDACTIAEGMDVVRMIVAAEKAAIEERWIIK